MNLSRLIFAPLAVMLLASQALAGEPYQFDTAHSSVSFSVAHLVISKTTGQFEDISASIVVDENDITKSSVEVTIKTASIETRDPKRNGHLRSADFLDVEKYPEITFRSTKIEKTGDGHTMTGSLTIKDVTKEVSFPFAFNGFVEFGGSKHFGAEASLAINRLDYHVTWNVNLDNGGLLVGNEVEIDLHLEAFREQGTN